MDKSPLMQEYEILHQGASVYGMAVECSPFLLIDKRSGFNQPCFASRCFTPAPRPTVFQFSWRQHQRTHTSGHPFKIWRPIGGRFESGKSLPLLHPSKKYYAQSGDQDDLISIGTIGLIKGISTFRADKNVRLATYASRCIENEILMHFRVQRKLQGEVSLTETLEAAGDGGTLSLMDVIAVDDNMLEELDTRDACVKVRQCVQTCLTPRERMIITMRYGLDDKPPRTQREIAGQCGISRSYVSRIEKKALEKLQVGMEGWSP